MAAPIPLMRPRPTRELRLPSPDQLAALGATETAKEIRARVYHDRVSERWVLDRHAPDLKHYEGKTAVWFASESDKWYASVYVPQQRARVQARRKAK